jgi:hypothetical protein
VSEPHSPSIRTFVVVTFALLLIITFSGPISRPHGKVAFIYTYTNVHIRMYIISRARSSSHLQPNRSLACARHTKTCALFVCMLYRLVQAFSLSRLKWSNISDHQHSLIPTLGSHASDSCAVRVAKAGWEKQRDSGLVCRLSVSHLPFVFSDPPAFPSVPSLSLYALSG